MQRFYWILTTIQLVSKYPGLWNQTFPHRANERSPPNLILTYILTYSMMQSPSWEANWFAASQEIPPISRNPKVHSRTHKRSPTVSILGQPNPVHISTSHILEIHPNIIHPSTPRSPQWSPSVRFPHQDPTHPPLLTHTRHMHSPFFSILSPAQYWVRSTNHGTLFLTTKIHFTSSPHY